MYTSKLNQRELELVLKALDNTTNELRQINIKMSILDLDHNKRRRAKNNQITNVLREYEDVLAKLEKELK